MKPGSSRRLLAVMAPTVAAVLAVALIVGTQYPFAALLFIAGILAVSSAALPAPAWSLWMQVASRMVRARRHQEPPAPAEDPDDRAQRERFHLDPAEYDARIQIGMPLGHLERLAYNLEGPLLALDRSERGRNAGQWNDLEAGPDLWPGGEWVHVIEEVRREEGWKP
jgi:hypothetical protein